MKERNIGYILYTSDAISLSHLLQDLRKREVISLLVEGGGKTIGSFVDAQLFDKVYAFHAPLLIGGERAISAVGGKGIKTIKEAIRLEQVITKHFGDNTLTIGHPKF